MIMMMMMMLSSSKQAVVWKEMWTFCEPVMFS
jgi:hypothetical protein